MSSKTLHIVLATFALTALAFTATLALSACRKETLGEKLDDATNSRPAEELQDAAEDMKDQIKDATN